MPIYYVKGEAYDIPEEKVQAFEARYPESAVEYENGSDRYRIPIDRREGFLKRFPDARIASLYPGINLAWFRTPNPEILNYETPMTDNDKRKLDRELARMSGNARRIVDEADSRIDNLQQFGLHTGSAVKKGKPVMDAQGNVVDTYVTASGGRYTDKNAAYASEYVPDRQQEYVEGLGAGFKQGWEGMKEGVKFFAGETANLFTGSGLDDKKALATLERLQAEGKTDVFRPGSAEVMDKSTLQDIALIRDVIEEAGGDMDKAKRILSERAGELSWGDKQMESAREGMSKMKPTKGFGAWVGNLIPQMLPSAAAMALSFVTKNPKYAKMIGGVNMGVMSASTAGQSMLEAREAGASNAETWAVGIADGVIEAATEKIPYDNYTKKLFDSVKRKTGSEMADVVNNVSSPGRAELEQLLTKANKKLGGKLFSGKNVKEYLASIAAEGLSEFTAEAVQAITPMIYEEPENYPVLTDILSNGWEGAKAGLFMGSVLGGASKIAEHHQERARRKQQGFVDVAQVHLKDKKGNAVDDVVEIVGKDKETGDLQVMHNGQLKSVKRADIVEKHRFSFDEFDNAALEMETNESYNNGYSLHTQQEMTDAKNMYEYQRSRMAKELGVEAEQLDDMIGDPLDFIHRHREWGTPDDVIQIALDYANAKSTVDGMQRRVNDDIESRVAMSNEQIDQRTNRNDGMVHPATMQLNDRAVHIIDGNIVMTDDGTMVDRRRSDATIIIRDAATGKVEFAAPEAILNVQEPIYAAEEKIAAEEQIRQQFMQEYENKASGRITAWNEGDAYTLADENGQPMDIKLVANEQGVVDNGDGTVNATADGKKVVAVPKEQIQQVVDEANMARVASYAATNEAKEVEEKTAATLPEYGFNYKVTLQSKDGEEITGTIGDIYDDKVFSGGEREFVVNIDEFSSSINGKRSPKLTQSELNGMVVSVQDADGNSVWKREESVLKNAENVPENAENVQNSPISVPKIEDNADLMPLTKDGEPDFYASSPQRSHKFIYEESGLDRNEANEFVQLQLDQANKALEKVKSSSQPKMGTSIMKYKQAKEQHQKLVDEAQNTVDYWKAVRAKQAEISKAEREEMAQKDAVLHVEAVEQANAEREAKKIAEAERAAVGNENPMPAITEKWAKANKVDGIQDEIVLPNGERIKGHYVLHESGASSASHQATNGFQKTDGFPMDKAGNTVNDRDYEGDKEAQDVTRGIASKYDQRALQTPVVVSQDGVVLSGNGRTMAGELAALDGTDSAYNEYLKQYSSKFGFSPEQVSQMQHPRVAFVPDQRMPYTAETFAKFNQQDMKAQNKTEQAVKLGKTVSDEVLAGILRTMNTYDTLGDFYNDASVSSQIVNMLVRDNVVPQAQVAEMYDGNKLSVVGREMLENILIGKSFEGTPDIVRMLTSIPSMRQSVLFALSEISNNLMLGSDYTLKSEIAEAIKLCYEARNKGGVQFGEDVTSYARQLNLFADSLQTVADYNNATIMMLANAINDKRISQLKKVLASYNGMAMDSATGQLNLFTGELKERNSIINDVLNLLNNGTEQQINAAGQAATEKQKESAAAVSENGASSQSDGTGTANERGGQGTDENTGRRQQNNLSEETGENKISARLSEDEIDEYGKSLVLAADGSTTFGLIAPESGLVVAPIKLSLGENYLGNDGRNHGYGLLHIEAGHGEQIREAGYDSVQQFVEEVAKNYTEIKEGALIGTHQTYLLEVSNEHNDTLFIQLSNDGTYWNVNSAGIFKKKYSRRKQKVYSVPAVGESTITDTSEVDNGQSMGETEPAGNSSESKDSKTSLNTSKIEENNSPSIEVNRNLEEDSSIEDSSEQPSVQTKIEAAEAETNTDPTEAQKKAGNYKMGHVQIGNFDISIENPAGSERKGVDANGKPWTTKMVNTYGYMRGTESVDGDHIDVFLANDMDAWNGRKVFVVDQYNEDGSFDEHKVMLGFNEQEDAEAAYFANYEKDWGKKHKTVVTPVNLEDFEKWVDSSHRKTKAFAEYKSVKSQNHLLDDVEVSGIINAMKDNATVIPFIEITDSNWRDSINTPIGSVKMGKNQRTKLFNKGREQQYGMLVESLYNPDIILEEKDKETNIIHERPSSYLFVKTFIKENGEKYVHFESVTVSQEGLEVSVSSHIIRENQLKNKLKSDRLLYKATALDKSANSSAEQPTNTGGSLSSENKDSKLAAEKQGDGLKSSEAKNESDEFGERVRVEDAEFPKGLSEDVVVMKNQKGGKRRITENVYVAMVNGDLYVKRYVRGYNRRNVSLRIPGAKKYDFNEIKYRLELGIGTSTDAVRLMCDAIDELYKRGDFQESILEMAERIAKEAEKKDQQGNPVYTDGSLLVEKVKTIDELTDEDFLNASRNVQLPALPKKVDEVIGANGKPVVIKKNIFEKNRKSHKDVSPAQSREIILEALYKPTMYGQNQKTKRPYNWILIHNAVKHSSVVLEVNHNKDNVEIVNWHYLEDDTLEQKKRQAINEGGLILTLESAAGNTINGLSSESKDNELVSEKQLLNENEIRESPFSEIMKDGAMAYINGNINFATSVAYQQIYNYVWNRSENNQSYSTGRSAAQRIAAVDEASGGRGGLNGVQTGRMAGETDQPGGSQNSKRVGVLSDGAGSDTAVRGEISADGGLSSGDTGRKGGGRTGRKGDNVRKPESERGSSGTVGEPVEEGSDSSNRGNIESCKDELKALLLEYEKASKKGLSLSVIGMNAEQIEIAGKILVAGVKLGYAYLKAGIIKFEHWNKAMHNDLALPFATSMHLSNAEIDEFIGDMWEYPYKVDGETRLLREWASIIGKAELRKKVGASLEEKRKAQLEAEPVAVKVCDRDNIAETLPFLLPQQQEDVLKAETQFFDESHNDRDHAFGKGYMFTNGTGTGKTYTGLGIVKRFIKQGKGRVLILTPSQTKVKDWVDDAKNLGIELNDLDAVAKAKKDGTTATTEKGEGAVITTYANFRQNKALLEDLFDLVVYDESHRLLENKGGTGTAGALQHYKLSNRNENYSYLRLQEIHPVWNAYQAKSKEFDAEREKLVERLKKEYGIANELVLGQRCELPPVLNGNWTGDAERRFPELAKLRNEVKSLEAEYEKNVKPELERQAKKETKHTKVVFLSATPFNTRENLDYAEGYVFSYPENDRQMGYAKQSPRSQFYLEHFGAGYRWRYNRLESSTTNAEAVSKQEIEFSDYLQHTLQTMSGRIIDSPYDYSRDFPTVTMEKAEAFNSAMEELSRDGATRAGYSEVMGDYNYTSALFESMKVSEIIPRLKAHLERGRKVVIFHRRMDSREPLQHPFAAIFAASVKAAEDEYDAQKKVEKKKRIASLKRKYADLLAWEQGLDLRMPREQLADAFGKDEVLFFSGKEGEKAKKKAVKDFNSDTSGKNIMVIQEASGKEGISLHDTTGGHQRVLVTLALPQSPITALQIEGRIYRIGNKSNAIFEYPLLGLNAEMMLFGQKFNEQVSTTENLALGSQARNLRESFARGVEEHSGDVDIDGQGVGGKELDAPSVTETDAFDRAVLDYYTNQKLTGRRDSRAGQDYYPTPEPLGYMMNQWGQIGEGESVLEPSAGHGAIARYVPRENPLTAVEPSQSLFSKLQIKAGGNGRKFENDVFENYNVANKHDVVLMNPPFGVGGRMAVDHVAKAFQHLDEGGRVVAIIPRGSTDKKFEKWYEGQKDAVLTAEIGLPDITFERAGTSVNCRVVVIDKVTNKDLRSDAASRAVHMDLSGMHFDKIEDFFEEIRNISVPERTIDYKAKMKKKATPVARELRGMKGIKKVELNENRIFVDGRGVWASLQWGDWQGDALIRHLANEYARFRKSEEYAAGRDNNLQTEVYGELKELCCKLASMTEDEMQRYITKKESNEDEDLYREDDDLEAVNDRFNEQLDRYVNGMMDKNEILHLGRPNGVMELFLPNIPIVMRQRILSKGSVKKHNVSPEALHDMPLYLSHPIFVFKRSDNVLGILTEMQDRDGKNVCVALELERKIQDGGSVLEVNDVRSVHGRNLSDIVYPIVQNGTLKWVDKKKGLGYLSSASRYVQQEIDKQDLISATKIVKDFENPSIDGENLYREDDDLEAVNDRFNEELERYERGELNSSEHLSLGYPQSPVTQYFMPNKEIILLQKVLTKGRKKHHLSTSEMRNLPKSMSEPIFVFKSGPNKLGMLLSIKADNGKNIFVAIDLGITKQLGHEFLEINDITSIHDRDVENIVLPIVENDSLKYADKKKGLNWLSSAKTNSQAITKEVLSRATKIVKEFENPSIEDENLRGGDGSFSDEELSYENDPIAKWLGKSNRSKRQQKEYSNKVREHMVYRVKELAEQLHLDNVEIVTDTSTLKGKKTRAKGWFRPKTGKIVVVISKHKSVADVEQTVLHEAVAHYGLRKLFGKHFDDFLWNVYNNASEDVRRKIAALAAKHGWNFPKATEEYLASLAEDTNFENAIHEGWFSKIKVFFIRMLAKAGVKLRVELGDNELRYILWRSYENMAEPGRYRGVIEQAADITMQYELGVGNYANGSSGQQHVAEEAIIANHSLNIVPASEKHGFKNYKEAKAWAKSNLVKTYNDLETGGKGNIRISGTAIDKFLSESAVLKSDSKDVHLSVMKELPLIIKESIDVEQHPDYQKGPNGIRSVDNGVNPDVFIHRLYGAVSIGNKVYRVKITIKEDIRNKDLAKKAYSYEATKVELLAGTLGKPEKGDAPRANNSITLAKLLKGVKKSYSDELFFASDDEDLFLREDGVWKREEKSLSDAIDDFTSTYNSAPIEIIHNDISVDELMEMFDVGESEAREMQEEIRGGHAAGGYSSSFKKIIIFADTITGEYEATLFHENIHAALERIYNWDDRKIADNFYRATTGKFERAKKALSELYYPDEVAEEFFVYKLSYAMESGDFSDIDSYLPESDFETLNNILKGIGYDKRREEGRRLRIRGRGRERLHGVGVETDEGESLRLRQNEDVSYEEADESDVFFREGDGGGIGESDSGGEVDAARSAAELYERGVANTLWNRLKEGWHDYLRSLNKLQEAIEKATGQKIEDFENVYQHALHKSSVDNAEWRAMMKKYVKPLNDVLHEITHGLKATFRGGKITLEVIETYLNCKHGLERNDKFAMRDAEELVKKRIEKADKELKEELRDAEKLRDRDLRKLADKRMKGLLDEAAYKQAVESAKEEYDKDVKKAQDAHDKKVSKIEKKLDEYYHENRERDYSGLTEIFDPYVNGVRKGLTVAELEQQAADYVKDFEAAVGAHLVGKLWDKVREMNRFSLRKSYETGMIGRESYKRTLDMFSYYVPLRGFDGEKAADVYDYITEGTTPLNDVLKHAGGRTSRAANLIATMMNMGNSAITRGNRNALKQRLLNLANNHDTGGLLTVSNQWYERVDEDEWKPADEPVFTKGMSAEEMRRVVEDYEEKMKEREALGEVKRMKNGLHLNVRIDSKRKEYEHGVRVKRNGTEYVVWVNGNPKAAQAINGLLNPEGKHGFLLDNMRRLGRFVSKGLTAFSPEFLLRNLNRDVISASMVGYAKYGVAYMGRFEKHVVNNLSLVGVKNARAGKFSGIFDLYRRYENGMLDMNVQRDRWFKEFIEHGGETGYSQVWSIEDYQHELNRQLKRHRADSQVMQAVAAMGTGVEFLNRGVENVCRFAAYCASRESGMNVLESVRDAKEASVNFNKKGSGALGNACAKALFLFLNPGIQGFVQQIILTKNYPKRMLPVLAGEIALGAMAVLIAQCVGDDDEEDDYYNLNPHVRRSNLILRTGNHSYARINLPPDMRPWYGLGEIAASALAGKMKYESVPLALLTNFSQMLPLDPVNDKAFAHDDENVLRGVFKNVSRGTGAGPWVDAYGYDEDFIGRKISGATEWNSLDPEWKRAGRNTSQLMTSLSKTVNELTGGDDATAGWVNFNPSKLEFALKGMLGGRASFPISVWRGCEAFFSDDPDERLDMNNYPFIRDFYIRTDNDRMRHSRTRTAYQWYKHEHDVFEHKLKTYSREAYEGGVVEYAEQVASMRESPAFVRHMLVGEYMKKVDRLYRNLKHAKDEGMQKRLLKYIDLLKKEMVDSVEKLEKQPPSPVLQ